MRTEVRFGDSALLRIRRLRPAVLSEMETQACEHVSQIREVQPSGEGCKECLKSGGTWVQLRECLICGHVGCCDSSPGRHATAHYHNTKHPVMRSFEPGQEWRWCYVDERMV